VSGRQLRVLRLCSVFEPPSSALNGRGARFDPVGGMQDHTGALTRVLQRQGVVQVVLTTRPPTAPWFQRISALTAVVRVGLPVPQLRQLYALPAAVLAPVLARRADLIHAHLGEDIAVLPLAVLAGRERRLPIVVTVHCSPARTVRVDGVRTALLKSVGGRVERWGERRAATTIALTSGLADQLARELPRERVRLIRRPIDQQSFEVPGPDPFPHISGPRVVFLGRLAPAKGVVTLIEALARLRTPGAQLLLVGDGPERSRLEGVARRLGVAERVHITGFVEHHRVPAVLASGDVLVLPSVYEELGTVLIEAMAVGLPVIASRVGGIPELIHDGENGLLVPPGDVRPLAAAIDRVLGDPDLARRLAAAARRRVSKHDWRHAGAEICRLYRQLAAGRPDGSTSPSRAGLVDRLALRLWPA
jgi:glycosyltransferase involved in cell wall biosynthesis